MPTGVSNASSISRGEIEAPPLMTRRASGRWRSRSASRLIGEEYSPPPPSPPPRSAIEISGAIPVAGTRISRKVSRLRTADPRLVKLVTWCRLSVLGDQAGSTPPSPPPLPPPPLPPKSRQRGDLPPNAPRDGELMRLGGIAGWGSVELGGVEFGGVEFGGVEFGGVELGSVELGSVEWGTVGWDSVGWGSVGWGSVGRPPGTRMPLRERSEASGGTGRYARRRRRPRSSSWTP